jgi:hypothetical protein
MYHFVKFQLSTLQFSITLISYHILLDWEYDQDILEVRILYLMKGRLREVFLVNSIYSYFMVISYNIWNIQVLEQVVFELLSSSFNPLHTQ